MKRLPSTPRHRWRETIESQGLVYSVARRDDGTLTDYWHEDAYYEVERKEVEHIEKVTTELYGMCLEAAKFMAEGGMGDLRISQESLEYARESLNRNETSIYGRFDFAYDGTAPAKMLEINGDTPVMLIESSICQHSWATDVFPKKDQFNSIHEDLVNAWAKARTTLLPGTDTIHFTHAEMEKTGEEWLNVAYMRETARQAGWRTIGINLSDIGYDGEEFVGTDNEYIQAIFKLQAWEVMMEEEFGPYLRSNAQAQWIEPPWKTFLSTKVLNAALWRLYPNHENLLPSFLDSPNGMEEWIAKPLFGREGHNIQVNSKDSKLKLGGDYGAEGFCYQQWNPLPNFDGNYAVIGSWVVDGKPSGIGIRESDGYITDFFARFLPHVIAD